MAEIESEIVAGRYTSACRNLEKLLSWRADPNGEIVYLLGSCELARGQNQAAGKAWARVGPGSAFWERAIQGRLRLLLDRGRFAAAEQLINDVANDANNDRSALQVLLAPLLGQLGCSDEAERLIEARWEHLNALGEGALEPAIKLLLLHIELTWKATPVVNVRAYLDRAARLAPEDDRVWLGRANLAVRARAYDEAGRLLDACLSSRPEDVPVWRARLRWGIAANRIDVVQQALTHLPAAASNPAQIHGLRAWLASHRGDVASERFELEHLIAVDPADLRALDRLSQLAEKDGQRARAAELLCRRAEIDRLRARYQKLSDRNQPIRDAVEMAHLAEQLGREFEARGFLTVAISEDPERENLRRDLRRMSQRSETVGERGQTLAAVLAHELRNEGEIDVTPSR
jgi:thioredoxin-like negative regulator of GroEL